MKHFLSFKDIELDEILGLVNRASAIKQGAEVTALRGKVMGLLFFRKSLRTRISLEAGLARYGATGIALNMGTDSWPIEMREGAYMDGLASEHIKEVAPLLGRYVHVLGIRTSPQLKSLEEEKLDAELAVFAKHASAPVMNLESSLEHPCQALADIITVKEKLGAKLDKPRNTKFVFTWLPQVRITPLATAHSVPMVGSCLGMDVTVVHPPGYELLPEFLSVAANFAEQSGGSFKVVVAESAAERDLLCQDADIVYGKNWSSPRFYGSEEQQTAELKTLLDWRIDSPVLGAKAMFMHCLPLRRNLKVTDAVLDSPRSVVVDQAENRMWGQVAVLENLLSN